MSSWIAFWRVVFLVCNLVIACLVFVVPYRRRLFALAVFAAAFWMFNRWTVHISYVAHLDYVPLLLLLASLLLFERHRSTALLLFGLSLGIKQIAVFLVPLYLIWVWQAAARRHAVKQVMIAALLISCIPLISSLPFFAWNAGGRALSGIEGFIKSIAFSADAPPSRPLRGGIGGWVAGLGRHPSQTADACLDDPGSLARVAPPSGQKRGGVSRHAGICGFQFGHVRTICRPGSSRCYCWSCATMLVATKRHGSAWGDRPVTADNRPSAPPILDPLARYASWCLAGVLLVAAVLRVWGINFGLPYVEHPDEPFWVIQVLKMIKSGDPNPHDFIYPSLYYYVNALIYLLYYGFGRLFGAFESLTDLVEPVLLIGGSGKTALPWLFLSGRSLSVVLGVATVALTFDLGRRITGLVLGGVLAGLWVAFSPTLVANSRFLIPDGPLAFFTTLVVWAAWRIYQDGRTRDLPSGGRGAGPGSGAEIQRGSLRPGDRRWRTSCAQAGEGSRIWRLYGAGAISLVVFAATTPFANPWTHKPSCKARLSTSVTTPAATPETPGTRWSWYLTYFWRTEGPVAVACGRRRPLGRLQTARAARLRSLPHPWHTCFSSVGLPFTPSASRLPLVPLFAVLAAYCLVSLLPAQTPDRKGVPFGAAAALLVIALIFPLAGAVRDTVRLTTPDGRDTARDWIDRNLPAGSRIGVESYAPWIDPAKFSPQGFYRLDGQPAEWYAAEGYDYLVFSQTMFRRFYADPAKFAADIARYEALFSAFEEVKVFTDGGYEVRGYRAPSAVKHRGVQDQPVRAA